ncbi:Nucleolar protein 12 [Grifola frondosa]|uniref:Nucleolar protein 12 n=1 Tax=Grifola frondosa TaxID=5627 RepID=A0A1C7LW63_GRIFR|nr:Nucleolar protein 12 [Grifola frondosa]
MTDKEKKRVAFIKHEIHEGIDAVNAYVVFAHPPPAATRAANLPPPAPVMDPREAAKACVEKGDGSLFMERTIRVDCVRKDGGERGVDMMKGDVKATVFVGNLDFASKEEDLRVFFEGLVSAERGPPAEEDGAETDEEDEEE